MHHGILQAFGLALLFASCLAGQPKIEQRPLVFPGGRNLANAKGALHGNEVVDYTLNIEGGGRYQVVLQAGGSTYFNILPPASEEAIFIGSISGRSYEGGLEKPGQYRIRVYQMRSSGRRGTVASYTLAVRRVAGFVAKEGEGGPAKYNAKGKISCSAGNDALAAQCEFRVVRKPGGQAEIWLQNPAVKGKFRVLDFAKGGFTTRDGAKVTTQRRGDDYLVIVNNIEHYKIVEAIITGG